MEKYFEENSEWVEKYPDVKVIKELPPMKAACFTYFGDEPEGHAFDEMKKWANAHGIAFHDQSYRIFGYNNPDPSNVDSDETYGVKEEEEIPTYRVAVFRAEGMDGEQNANESWGRALAFAKEHGLDSKECRIFQYNKGFSRKPPFFHVVMITLPESFVEDLPEISIFPADSYMTIHVSRDRIGEGWMLMEKWKKDTKAKAARHQWVEEWTLDNWE